MTQPDKLQPEPRLRLPYRPPTMIAYGPVIGLTHGGS
jgi:hypothetical protein